jgi:hypothetical protein
MNIDHHTKIFGETKVFGEASQGRACLLKVSAVGFFGRQRKPPRQGGTQRFAHDENLFRLVRPCEPDQIRLKQIGPLAGSLIEGLFKVRHRLVAGPFCDHHFVEHTAHFLSLARFPKKL